MRSLYRMGIASRFFKITRLSVTIGMLLGMVLGALSSASAAPPLFDFSTEAGRQGWQPTHDIKSLAEDAEGLRI